MPKVENIIGPQTDNIIKIEVICSSCGHSVSFKPDLGNQNITVNGKVCPSSPCSQCGGLLQSKEGIYRFSDGLLMEENV
jgi:hypothetical protein